MSGAELLTSLLKTISDSVLIVDSTDRITYCGGGGRWVQLSALKGKTLDEVFSEELSLLLSNLVEQVRNGETVQQTEVQLLPEQQPALAELGLEKPHWYRLSCSPMADKVILSLHDVSRQREIEDRASKQSQRDPLTGAYNRRSLVPVLNQAVAQAQRYEYHCSLALVDVDGFTRINERYGWDGGDMILQAMVDGLDHMKRDSDFLVRIGDDQLALMLPETSLEQSRAVGQRILKLVADLELERDGVALLFNVSVGTATLEGPLDSAEAMIRRASENLLIAKQSGGSRVETDET